MSTNFENRVARAREVFVADGVRQQAEATRREAEQAQIAAAARKRHEDAMEVEHFAPRVTRALKVAGHIIPSVTLLPYTNDIHTVSSRTIPGFFKEMSRLGRYERFVRDNSLTGWSMHTRYITYSEDGAGDEYPQFHDLYLGDDARVYERHDGFVGAGRVICNPSTAEPDIVLDGLANLVARYEGELTV